MQGLGSTCFTQLAHWKHIPASIGFTISQRAEGNNYSQTGMNGDTTNSEGKPCFELLGQPSSPLFLALKQKLPSYFAEEEWVTKKPAQDHAVFSLLKKTFSPLT